MTAPEIPTILDERRNVKTHPAALPTTVFVVRWADGSEGLITKSRLASLRAAAEAQSHPSAQIGAVVAGCDESSQACWVGTVTSVFKAHKVVTTRGGSKIKQPLITPTTTFEAWDAALADQMKWEANAPKIIL